MANKKPAPKAPVKKPIKPVARKPGPQPLAPLQRPIEPYVADPYANQLQSMAQFLRSKPPPMESLPYSPPMPYNPSAKGPATMQPFEPQMSTGLTYSPQQNEPQMSTGLTYNPPMQSLPRNPPTAAGPMQQPFDIEGFQQRFGAMPALPSNQYQAANEYQRGNQFSNFGNSQAMSPWQSPNGNRPMQQPFGGMGGGGMGGFQQPFGGKPQRPSSTFGADPYVNRMQPYGGAQMSPGLTYPQNQGTRTRPGRFGGSVFSNKRGVFG